MLTGKNQSELQLEEEQIDVMMIIMEDICATLQEIETTLKSVDRENPDTQLMLEHLGNLGLIIHNAGMYFPSKFSRRFFYDDSGNINPMFVKAKVQ